MGWWSYWLFCLAFAHGMRVATPNDPKLSDRRSWRALCAVGVALLVCTEAQGMTAEPVRCSAWLGVADIPDWAWITAVFVALWAMIAAATIGYFRSEPWHQWWEKMLAAVMVLSLLVAIARLPLNWIVESRTTETRETRLTAEVKRLEIELRRVPPLLGETMMQALPPQPQLQESETQTNPGANAGDPARE